jgi:hypothetical protein
MEAEMLSKLTPKRPSLGTALGFIAIVIALGGYANAAPSRVIVQKGDIAPGAVTAKTLAKGAVNSRAIAKEAVHSADLASESVNKRVIKKQAVGTRHLADNAVTAQQLAPGSVYGGALGAQSVVTKPIADLDAVAHNGEWTASNTETVLCGPGERLTGSGFAFTNPGNRQVAWLQALPIVNGPTNGVSGQITSDSGGTATAVVAAVCLK